MQRKAELFAEDVEHFAENVEAKVDSVATMVGDSVESVADSVADAAESTIGVDLHLASSPGARSPSTEVLHAADPSFDVELGSADSEGSKPGRAVRRGSMPMEREETTHDKRRSKRSSKSDQGSRETEFENPVAADA